MLNGKQYRVKPVFAMPKDGVAAKAMAGEVIWTHPRGRFAVLEFAGGVRECFFLEQLTAGNLMLQKKGR